MSEKKVIRYWLTEGSVDEGLVMTPHVEVNEEFVLAEEFDKLKVVNQKMLAALRLALPFAKKEQGVREYSFLPEPGEDEQADLEEVSEVIEAIEDAIASAEDEA